MSKYKDIKKANERIDKLEQALDYLVFDAEQIYSVGFLTDSLQWIPKESVIDSLEVRVGLVKELLNHE